MGEIDQKMLNCIYEDEKRSQSEIHEQMIREDENEQFFNMHTCRSDKSDQSWIYNGESNFEYPSLVSSFGIHRVFKFCVKRSRHLFEVEVSKYQSVLDNKKFFGES